MMVKSDMKIMIATTKGRGGWANSLHIHSLEPCSKACPKYRTCAEHHFCIVFHENVLYTSNSFRYKLHSNIKSFFIPELYNHEHIVKHIVKHTTIIDKMQLVPCKKKRACLTVIAWK
ncbi:MAG: hypothetical protein MKZ63_06670 [Nitrospinales bacterium]|nr:hypothetical protein [Nitrospinales bacterium]